MSTKLVILGLLQEKPLHGYELKHIIEQHMGDWTNIAFGSIYFALGKLKDEGFVEIISEEKIGNRPSRNVYKITDKGKLEFLSILKEIWQRYEREYYPLDIALAFSSILPADEVKKYINDRIVKLEETLTRLNNHKKEQLALPEMPKFASAVFSHTEYHLKAELNWLKELLGDICKGLLF
jgi:DNA-binding PadR family transcriptional regulator